MNRAVRFVAGRGWVKLVVCLALVASVSAVQAHIGSPNVFFEGLAGPYPVRVVIRPPPVIPGLAEISVRVATNGIDRVTALPMRWNTARQGAPPPDEALPVRGETNLFNTELWFMQGGAQSVEVSVSGRAGTGAVIVPVNAVATRGLEMPRGLGMLLGGLGMGLILLMASVIGAAVRESALAAGAAPGVRRRWGARAATVLAAVVLGLAVWLGKRWWDSEVADYQNNRLYRPRETAASVRLEEGRRWLRVELQDERFRKGAPLVPDHGKLMHLFLVREPALDAFAHLHPARADWKTFECALPDLPAGEYRLYADVTYETGAAETLTAKVTMPTSTGAPAISGALPALDRDDSWRVAPPLGQLAQPAGTAQSPLSSHFDLHWLPDNPLEENRETRLVFEVRDRAGRPRRAEPYLGMLGHLVLRHEDGSVFTHLHPGGSFSMAAQQLFELRAEGKAPLRVAAGPDDPFCRLPTSEEIEAAWQRANPGNAPQPISFLYAFPKPGRYRLWAQVKIKGEVLTGVFDVEVQAAR